jgi:signal recognition particle subunit SRP54
MADMMKAMGKRPGGLAGLAGKLGLGGALGGGEQPSPEDLAKLAEQMPGGSGLPGLGKPGLGKFPGLGGGGGKLPTPGGLPPDFFKKK